MRGNKYQRKGISPLIATLTLIAVTLVAAVAVGGYVFGIFGSQTSTAQVSVTYAQISAREAGSEKALKILVGDNQSRPTNPIGTIKLVNSGTSSIGISGLSLTYGGTTAFASASSGTIQSGSTQTIYIIELATNATAGQQFTGAVVLSNGVQVPFSGTFV